VSLARWSGQRMQSDRIVGCEKQSFLTLHLSASQLGSGGGSTGPFDDEETRAFYEDLPDLLAMLPPTLLGLTVEEAERCGTSGT
jgi:hypothetical protein